MTRFKDTVACPTCRCAITLPLKSHPMIVRITCPHCSDKLIVELGVHGVHGVQRAEWAQK